MATGNSVAPVIIKRKKVSGGDGHHGGAWKVAYADFVTAMMAFFMLMWLLNATTEKQRKGIADYFNPSIPISRISGGGDGAFGAESLYAENRNAANGQGTTGLKPPWETAEASANSQGTGSEEAQALLEEIEAQLTGDGGESQLMENELRHIISKLSDEGVVIELFDVPGSPLFLADGHASRTLERLLSKIASIASNAPNELAIVSHTQSQPIVRTDYDVWRRSTERSVSVSDRLEFSGVPRDRISRLTGKGDKQLATNNPLAVRNNRIEIVFLIDQ